MTYRVVIHYRSGRWTEQAIEASSDQQAIATALRDHCVTSAYVVGCAPAR